jgi:hypothetical protein
MKTKIIIFLTVCCTLPVQSQTMRDVFGKLPESIDLLVDSLKRQDLMNRYETNRQAKINNLLNDSCELITFSDHYLKLKCDITQIELILLPLINDSKIIGCIKTVCAPVCDSQLTFYSEGWQILPSDAIITPVSETWFYKEEALPETESGWPEMELMQYTFIPEKQALVQTYNTPQYVDTETRTIIEPLLKNTSKIYEWKKNGFK